MDYAYESSNDAMDTEEFAEMYGKLTLLADEEY